MFNKILLRLLCIYSKDNANFPDFIDIFSMYGIMLLRIIYEIKP